MINFPDLIYEVSKGNDYQLDLLNDIFVDLMYLLDIDDHLFSIEKKNEFFALEIINR